MASLSSEFFKFLFLPSRINSKMKYYKPNQIPKKFITNISERIIQKFDGECFQCDFSIASYTDDIARQLLTNKLPTFFNTAVQKRKAEFVAGRYLSKIALEVHGAKNTHVGIKENREPQWPPSYTGSISHSNEFAVCAVADRCNVKSIGIDVEEIISFETAESIADFILLEPEVAIVNKDVNMLTLAFSAKESLFKALYLEAGFYFGFEYAKITRIDKKNKSFTLKLLKNLTPELPAGSTFDGVFEFEEGRVFTAICRAYTIPTTNVT